MDSVFNDWNFFRWVTTTFTVLKTWEYHWAARI